MSYRGRDCPTCSALAGEPCRTAKTNRVTDSHSARFSEEAAEQTKIRVVAEERERARARWLEPSRTR